MEVIWYQSRFLIAAAMSASQHKGGNQHNGGNQHKGGNLTGYVCYAAVWVCTDLCGYVQTYQQKEVISLGRNGTPLCGYVQTYQHKGGNLTG